jgi:hypothetical protein
MDAAELVAGEGVSGCVSDCDYCVGVCSAVCDLMARS